MISTNNLSNEALIYLKQVLKADADCLQDILDNSPSEFWSEAATVQAAEQLALNLQILAFITQMQDLGKNS
jgi:hypothetical protein